MSNWKWEEDGYTVYRGTARTAPGCHDSCGVLFYTKDGRIEKVEGDPSVFLIEYFFVKSQNKSFGFHGKFFAA